MNSRREQDFFNHFISGLDSKLQAQLRLQYAHNKAMNEYEHKQEMQRMKQEIIDEVLARLSVIVENGEALQKIEALEKAIARLGQ